jgi:hypothetical protein
MTITLPLKVGSYISAMAEAQEISLTVDVPVYLFRVMEGGYVIDTVPEVYSNEKLIIKLFKGERQ